MNNIILISQDERIITEVSTVSAVTGTTLSVHSACDALTLEPADTVLIDAQSEGALTHGRLAIVCFGPAGPQQWMAASLRGATRIIELPDARSALTEFLDSASTKRSRVIAVSSLARGFGSTTLSIAVASLLAKRGRRTLLIDGDPDGGLDVVAGIENVPGIRWNDIVERGSTSSTLPTSGGIQFLSTNLRAPRCVPQLSAADPWVSTAEVTIWDIPGGEPEMLADLNLDVLCTVVPNTVRAVTLAKRDLAGMPGVECGLVVRSVPGASIDPMDIAEITGLPLWAVVPSDVRVVEQIEQGLGPSSINLGGYTRSVAGLVDRLVGSAPHE